jgi:hypothetical protein
MAFALELEAIPGVMMHVSVLLKRHGDCRLNRGGDRSLLDSAVRVLGDVI